MSSYFHEAEASMLSGVITVGATAGYAAEGTTFSLDDTLDIIHDVNKRFDNSIWPLVPSMVREEHLVGRASESKYQEKLYKLTFAWSPRQAALSNNTFFEGLCEYGFKIGREMQQQRVYVDFQGQTHVFKLLEEKSFDDSTLEDTCAPLLLNCRPNWDLPHTQESVHWMNALVDTEGGDRKILVTAMWLHDVGNLGMFNDIATYDGVMETKSAHVTLGAEKVFELLPALGYLPSDVRRVSDIVRTHGDLDLVESPYEQLVMEADVLGQISQNLKNSTYSAEDDVRFFDLVQRTSAPRFRTKTGRKFLDELLEK
jgi:hypothetical protein